MFFIIKIQSLKRAENRKNKIKNFKKSNFEDVLNF